MTEAPPGAAGLVVPPPTVDESTAAAIAERAFGLAGTGTELGGERDRNFRVEADDGTSYLLKLSNPADGPEVLDLQNAAMRHAARTAPDLPVMQPMATLDGDDWTSVTDEAGEPCLARLFTYLPGRTATAAGLDHDALAAYGETVARVGLALRGFFHPAADYEVLWDLRHVPALGPLLDDVPAGERRDLATTVVDRFEARVAPAFESLRAQVVHNDLTFDNVRLGDGDRVVGIVDFGDLTHTALVGDLAIAAASAMHGRDDPVEAARAVTRGYARVTPLEAVEARLLGDLVTARVAAWGVIVAWRVAEHPDLVDHTADGVEDAWSLLRRLEGQGFDAVGRRLEQAAKTGRVPVAGGDTADLLDRRRRALGRSPLSYQEPVHVVDGEGPWLVDPAGRRHLDAYNNVQPVGHANPDVAGAIAGQARTLATNTRYLHASAVELAERLLATLPDELDRLVLVNSGSEANDLAWRLATASTGQRGALVTAHAYHGITEATTALSPECWPAGDPPAHVETIPPPGEGVPPRGPSAGDPVAATEAGIDALDAQGRGLAAFVFDSILTSDGIYPPDADRLAAVADRVRAAGGLVVADEVQAGFGRTGSTWGFESTGLVPDVVTMGKPMGNGHPVAAVATRSDLVEGLRDRTGLFSTFGGNPVSCAAALATLDAIEAGGLPASAVEVGDYLRAGLADLADAHDVVGDVRGRGLMVGVELVRDRERWTPATEAAAAVVEGLRGRRVLVGSTGPADNVLKLRPPLVFERAHADRLLEALDETLANLD